MTAKKVDRDIMAFGNEDGLGFLAEVRRKFADYDQKLAANEQQLGALTANVASLQPFKDEIIAIRRSMLGGTVRADREQRNRIAHGANILVDYEEIRRLPTNSRCGRRPLNASTRLTMPGSRTVSARPPRKSSSRLTSG